MREEEIEPQLGDLANWKVITSLLPGVESTTRTELVRQFHFTSFELAIAFMQAAVPYINLVNHHPRWENAYKTVTVYLSTWDQGHKVSQLDLNLAFYLDRLFEGSNH